jgi:hypothetical protein
MYRQSNQYALQERPAARKIADRDTLTNSGPNSAISTFCSKAHPGKTESRKTSNGGVDSAPKPGIHGGNKSRRRTDSKMVPQGLVYYLSRLLQVFTKTSN